MRSVADLDRRTTAARNAAKLIERLQADLGGDLTAGQQELITRAALLSILAGDAEVAIIRGQAIDVASYCTLANTQRRVLMALGLRRDPKIIDGHADDDGDGKFRQELIDILRDGPDEPAEQDEARP